MAGRDAGMAARERYFLVTDLSKIRNAFPNFTDGYKLLCGTKIWNKMRRRDPDRIASDR
jgi:hypothetical protein